MKFKEISIRNFLSYGDKLQTIELDNQGLVLIAGDNEDTSSLLSNGSGKSSCLEAIIYALFGSLSSGLQGDDVVNNHINKNMEVDLSIDLGNNNVFTIKRYRKHSEYKNKVILFLNGDEVTKKSAKDNNDYIQTVLGITKDTFLNSIIFGLGDKVKFTEATDAQKKQLLEDIANISLYKEAQVKAKEHLATCNSDLAKCNQDLNTALDRVSFLKEIDKNNQDHYKALKDRDTSIRAHIQELESKLDSLPKVTKEQVQGASERYTEENKKKSSVVFPRQAQLDKINKLLNSSSIKLQDIKSKLDIATKNLVEKKKQYDGLVSGSVDHCYYCGQLLNKEHRDKELNRLSTEINTGLVECKELLGRKTKGEKYVGDLTKASSLLNVEYKKFLSEQDKASSALSKYYSDYVNLNTAYSERSKVEYEIQGLKSTLGNAIELPELHTEEINNKNKEIDTLGDSFKSLVSEKERWEDAVAVYSNQGVISNVLDFVMPFLNTQANKYLSILSGNTISVNISTQTKTKGGSYSDKLSISVDNTIGGEDYQLNSKGEKKRIDLSIALALQDYVMSTGASMGTNFVAYDEVFDGLDSVGIQQVMSLLSGRVKDISSIFVISHDNQLKDLFENVLSVKKKNGMSELSGTMVKEGNNSDH